MLDAYIIDQIRRKEQEEKERKREQPVIYTPILPSIEDEGDENEKKDRGEIIIQLYRKNLKSII